MRVRCPGPCDLKPFENIGIDAQVDRFFVAGHALNLFFGEGINAGPVGQIFMHPFAESGYCKSFRSCRRDGLAEMMWRRLFRGVQMTVMTLPSISPTVLYRRSPLSVCARYSTAGLIQISFARSKSMPCFLRLICLLFSSHSNSTNQSSTECVHAF